MLHSWCILCARCGELLRGGSETFGGDGAFDGGTIGGARRCRACRNGRMRELRAKEVALGLDGVIEDIGLTKRKRARGKWRWCCGGGR